MAVIARPNRGALSRRAALTLLAGAALGAAQPAAAQSWLQKGRELWNTYGGDGGAGGLSVDEIAQGLREALKVGTATVVAQLGTLDGFNADPRAHIPLPSWMATAQNMAQTVGLSGMLDDLELRLNRAAEVATPKAKALFWDAIGAMTIDDAKAIYDGPDDAATRYFQGKMTEPLKTTFRPIVNDGLRDAGAVQAFDDFVAQYAQVPFAPALADNAKGQLVDHGLDGTLAGLFLYLAEEEKAIRQNPAKRTTAILQRVFGA
jgi:hypothetical protein